MTTPDWSEPKPTALLVLADGTVVEGVGLGATRQGGRRGLLQHGDDRLSGDPDRPLLCRADRHLHVSAYRQCRRQRGGHRDGERRGGVRRAGCRAQNRYHRTRELARHATVRSVAEGARHRRHRRDRHARADRAHPRERHAERHRRARAGRRLRRRGAEARGSRAAVHDRARPRARRHDRPELHLGRDDVAARARDTGVATASPPSTSSRSTTASSATSCGSSPTRAAR